METKALENSTYIPVIEFTDASGEAVTPDSVKWTLVNSKNEVINGREQVEVADSDLDSEINIVLSGDDLKIENQRRSEEKRWLVVEATYTSDEGSDLPANQQHEFVVVNLKYIE